MAVRTSGRDPIGLLNQELADLRADAESHDYHDYSSRQVLSLLDEIDRLRQANVERGGEVYPPS